MWNDLEDAALVLFSLLVDLWATQQKEHEGDLFIRDRLQMNRAIKDTHISNLTYPKLNSWYFSLTLFFCCLPHLSINQIHFLVAKAEILASSFTSISTDSTDSSFEIYSESNCLLLSLSLPSSLWFSQPTVSLLV